MEVLEAIAGFILAVAFFYILIYGLCFGLVAIAFNIFWKIWRKI